MQQNRLKILLIHLISAIALLLAATPALNRAAGLVYYVSINGSNSNVGSLDAPFRTIQRCADIAVAGSSCIIREGTYRETVIPTSSGQAGSPIIFTAYPGEVVTVSGADLLTGWVQHSGNIYRTIMPWTVYNPNDLPYSNDQLFVNGMMVNEARWPNIAVGGLSRSTMNDQVWSENGQQISNSQGSYTAPALASFTDDFWKNAQINFNPGLSTIANTCTVASNYNTTLEFQCSAGTFSKYHWRPRDGDFFYLWGKYEALDTAGEWFRSANGTTYLWTPNNQSPQTQVVEAKSRIWAFDLSGRQNIIIRNLKLFAASIKTSNATSNILIDTVNAQYIWHFSSFAHYSNKNNFYVMLDKGGITLRGHNNEIRDSYIAYSAANGVVLWGEHNRVVNTVFHDIGYMGGSDVISGMSGNPANPHYINQNTIFNAGRSAITLGPALNIMYNDIYRTHLQMIDIGMIYGFAVDGQGTTIAYNLLHDATSPYNSSLQHWGSYGIYLDDDTYNFDVYRNIIWNTTNAGLAVMGNNGTFIQPNRPYDQSSNRRFYNNTVDGLMRDNYKNTTPVERLLGVEFKNNIANKALFSHPETQQAANIAGEAFFVNRPAHNYQLRSYSPAVDHGIVIPLVTDGYLGTSPDIGALEKGARPFVAGALLRAVDLAQLNTTCSINPATSSAQCLLNNLPIGRTLPQAFQLRIGGVGGSASCTATMDYNLHLATASCTAIPLASQTGIQPIMANLGDNIWIATQGTIDLGNSPVLPTTTLMPTPTTTATTATTTTTTPTTPTTPPATTVTATPTTTTTSAATATPTVPTATPSPILLVTRVDPESGSTLGGTLLTITGNGFETTKPLYRTEINITNPSGQNLIYYQVPILFNSQALINQSKMRPDCGDLRFDDSEVELSYWIEQGCGTEQTRVWVNTPYIPIQGFKIAMSYGDMTLESASDPQQTFILSDDFETNTLSNHWQLSTTNGTTISASEGVLRIAGITVSENQYDMQFARLDMSQLNLPPSFAIDAEVSVISQSPFVAPKMLVGGNESAVALFSPAIGDLRVGYWSGNRWEKIGDSGLDTLVFSNQHVSTGYTFDGALYYFENNILRSSRNQLFNQYLGHFGYSPNAANKSFDVRFDNVRVRNFVYPEPQTQLGTEVMIYGGVQVLINDNPCLWVTAISETKLTCMTPSGKVGIASITVNNSSNQKATLVDSFTYIDSSPTPSGTPNPSPTPSGTPNPSPTPSGTPKSGPTESIELYLPLLIR